jgi:hypothetical protein
MSRTIRKEARELLQRGLQAQPRVITEAQVLALPAVAQRYLNYAGAVGKEPIHTVRLTQHGAMRTQPNQKWLPMVAEQYFTVAPPAFLWQATMRLFPFVWVSATDQFSEGHGNMRIKLLSVIPMGNARGPEMNQGAMQRYLAEAIWFPTAWLSDAIVWQSIDTHSVKAIMHASHVTAPVMLHVNEQGQVTHVTADRYKEEHGHYLLAPWSGQCNEYQEVEGMCIPTRIEVTWHLASGDFTWFRCKITEIEYNQSGKVTRL